MPFEGGWRRKILVLIEEKLRERKYFASGGMRSPVVAPPDYPAWYLALKNETIVGETNLDHETDFMASLIIFVESNDEVDLAKADSVDEAEEVVMALQKDSGFTALGASQIHIDTVDYTQIALHSLGFDFVPVHPVGVSRLDIRAEVSYQSITP